MPSIKQAIEANNNRKATLGEDATSNISGAPTTAPTPPQDMPLGQGLPQRGMYSAQFVLSSDRSDSSRAFRGFGMRSAAFPYTTGTELGATNPAAINTNPSSSSSTTTISSVALTMPMEFSVVESVSQDEVSINVTWNTEIAGYAFMGPIGSGLGTPSFRYIVNSDLAQAIFGAAGPNHAPGAVPDPGSTAGITLFLREDGTWAVPGGGSGSGFNQSILVDTTAMSDDYWVSVDDGTYDQWLPNNVS